MSIPETRLIPYSANHLALVPYITPKTTTQFTGEILEKSSKQKAAFNKIADVFINAQSFLQIISNEFVNLTEMDLDVINQQIPQNNQIPQEDATEILRELFQRFGNLGNNRVVIIDEAYAEISPIQTVIRSTTMNFRGMLRDFSQDNATPDSMEN